MKFGGQRRIQAGSRNPHDSDYGSIEIKVFQHWICEASDNEVRLIIHDLEQAKSFITAIKEVVRNVENYQKNRRVSGMSR